MVICHFRQYDFRRNDLDEMNLDEMILDDMNLDDLILDEMIESLGKYIWHSLYVFQTINLFYH